jgi:uroporphyrinogen III methyltransferase/synthase
LAGVSAGIGKSMTSVLISPADADLAHHLQRLGARAITWPEVMVTEAENSLSLNQALDDLYGYDWLILKNERAARHFLQRLAPLHDADALDELRVLTIGEATAERLTDKHIHADVVLERFQFGKTFTSLESYLGGQEGIAGLNFLVPSANITGEIFEEQLDNAGARVDSVTAYRTTTDRNKLAQISALLIGGGINCVAFTTTGAMEQLAQLLDSDDLPRLLSGIQAACLDAETAALANTFGLTAITASETSPAVFAALITGISA